MWSVKSAIAQSCGTQPEVVRSSVKHAVLPTCALYVGQQIMFQVQFTHMWQ